MHFQFKPMISQRIVTIFCLFVLAGCWATDPEPDLETYLKKSQKEIDDALSNLNCPNGYKGPNTQAGIQRDSQCLAVYAYLCAGVPRTDFVIVTACQNYADLNPPGGPECPYCN